MNDDYDGEVWLEDEDYLAQWEEEGDAPFLEGERMTEETRGAIEFGSAHANALAREMRAYDLHPELAEIEEEIASVEATIYENRQEIAVLYGHLDELKRRRWRIVNPTAGTPVLRLFEGE